MRALVVHNTLNSAGGSGRVCLGVISALKELGYEITLLTVEPTDWTKVREMFGEAWLIKPDKEVHVLPFRTRAFGIYARLLTFLRMGGKYDLCVNTHGDALPVRSDIIYMHYPVFALLKDSSISVKYSRSRFWRLYFKPYEYIQSHLVRNIKHRAKVIATNSEFSREAIKKYLGIDAKVVYPPVDIDVFINGNEVAREDRVVSCGRFAPEKNYEFIIDVASHLPQYEFVIIGASSGRVSSAYYNKLMRLVRSKGVENVRLMRDVSRSEQVRIYKKSKVFLHAMRGEHFGVAVVEAMASGLVPVVHESGGAWTDIVDRGEYGYGYKSLEGAIEAVERAMHSSLKARIRSKVEEFSADKFNERFKALVEEVSEDD